MDQDLAVVFEVRNDKDRGIVILTIRSEAMSYNVHFFKYHHQPIHQHPEQIQRIVRAAKPTTRTKSVRVNITPFAAIYWNYSGGFFEFKGLQLNSTENQILKVQEMKINKEIGGIKRKNTIEATRFNKEVAVREKLASDEKKFQEERARRIKEAMADMMDVDTAGTNTDPKKN